MTDKKLIENYMNAKYVVTLKHDTCRLRVGIPNSEIDGLFNEHGTHSAYFITPENPFSQKLCEAENEFRHQRFVSVLHDKKLSYLEGYGTDEDETWPKEHSYLVFCDDAAAMQTLAANFGQKGLLKLAKGHAVSLLVLDEMRYHEIS